MLSRPEIGSRAHILLWLASKDPNETYVWANPRECVCGQYAREHGIKSWDYSNTSNLNTIAQNAKHDFGSVYEAARKAWDIEALTKV